MRTPALLLTLMLLLGSCGGGAPDSGPDPNPDPGQTYVTLAGTVLNAGNTPISGVEVLLGQNPSVTDAHGKFTYTKLLLGKYTLSLQDGAGNFDCREVTLTEGTGAFSFALPSGGALLHATRVNPGLNSVGAALDSDITVTFSNELKPAVSIGAISITPEIGDFTALASGTSLVIHPRLQLPLNQLILVEITGGIQSISNEELEQPLRWRFRTSGLDDSAPRFIGSMPAAGTTGYPPNSPLRLEFNEAIGPVDPDLSVTITPEVPLNISASGRYLLLSTVGGFALDTAYSLTVSGVRDLPGNRSAAEINLSFTTGHQAAPQHNLNPEWNRSSDRIVFCADQAGSFDIFSVRPDGTELTQLTTLPGNELHPTLSNDGSLLAFQYRLDSGNWSIYIQNITETREPVQLTADEFSDIEPFFSRTATDKLVYVSNLALPAGLFLMNSDGSNPTEQDRNFGSQQSEPALHPLLDTQLLFTSNNGGNRDIWRKTVSAIDGTVINQNLTGTMLSDDHHSAWGPDASYIVFISDFGGSDNVWYAEATGEFPRQITTLPVPVLDLCVSPYPGDQLAVISIQTTPDSSDLAIIELVTGEIASYLTGEEAGNQQ